MAVLSTLVAFAGIASAGRILSRDTTYSSSVTDSSFGGRLGSAGQTTTINNGVTYWINGASIHNIYGNLYNLGSLYVSQTSYIKNGGPTTGQIANFGKVTSSDGVLNNQGLIQLDDIGSSGAPSYTWNLRTLTNSGTLQLCGRGDTGGSNYQLYSDNDSYNTGLISMEQSFNNYGSSFVWKNSVLTSYRATGSNLYNNGAVRLINTVYHNVQNVYGNGCWQIGANAVLYLESGSGAYQNPTYGPTFPGQSIAFTDSTADLHMDSQVYSLNSNFGPRVYGFGKGNAIEFQEVIFSFRYASGVLTVTLFTGNTVNIKMAGYTASLFSSGFNPSKYGSYNAIFYSGSTPSAAVVPAGMCSLSAPICQNLGTNPPVISSSSSSTSMTSTQTSSSSSSTLTSSSISSSASSSSTSSRAPSSSFLTSSSSSSSSSTASVKTPSTSASVRASTSVSSSSSSSSASSITSTSTTAFTSPYTTSTSGDSTYSLASSVTNMTGTIVVASTTSTSASQSTSSPLSSSSSSSIPAIPSLTSSTVASSTNLASSSGSSSSSSSAASATASESLSYQPLGCYTDTVSDRTLNDFPRSVSSSMTIEMCNAYCLTFSALYAGVEYGTECYCGNSLLGGSVQAPASDCSFACPGNSDEVCGAGNRLSLSVLTSGGGSSNVPSSVSSPASPSASTSTSSLSTAVLPTTSDLPASTTVLPTYQTSTSAQTSSTSAPAATSSILSCPSSDGQTYTTPDGSTWLVECYNDHAGGDLTTTYATTLQGCISNCDATVGCVAFSWGSTANGASNPCYLKSSIGADQTNSGIWGGKLVSSSPSSSSVGSTSATLTLPASSSSTS